VNISAVNVCRRGHALVFVKCSVQVFRRQSCGYLSSVPRGVFPFKRGTAGEAPSRWQQFSTVSWRTAESLSYSSLQVLFATVFLYSPFALVIGR
jgi:hypothetical protein